MLAYVFLNDESGLFAGRWLRPGHDGLETVHHLNAPAARASAWLHNPQIQRAVVRRLRTHCAKLF